MKATTPPVVQKLDRGAPPAGARRLRLPSAAAALTIARRVLVVVLAAGLIFGAVQLFRLPQLAVSATSTQIGGAQRITPEQIYSASGIEGRNIFLVRPGAVAAAIAQIGGIAAVKVHVRLPNQVLIDVWEHAPLVAWQGATATIWLTAEGQTVPQAGLEPPLRLVDQTEATVDANNPLAQLLLRNLVALHAARPDVTEVAYNDNQGLHFRTPEGWEVWLGDSGSLDQKLALLEIARQEITRLGRQAQVIDLRHSNQRAIWW